MSQIDLFTPVRVGAFELPNRIAMAPMTRSRAGEGNAPTPLMAEYYAQRASAGLIISEATQVNDTAQGYPSTPGVHTNTQAAGWRRVTEAVHAKGGRIFVQLWHVGRISHPIFQPNGAPPVAPSAIAAAGELYTGEGMKPFPVPRALETAEIPGLVRDFAEAAKRAVYDAGFDGVEIHGANGYLIDQFLRDGTNKRTDAYGGSIENRARFLLEIVEATVAAIGADRVGVRLSPNGTFNDMRDSDPVALFTHVAKALSTFNLAYLHVIEGIDGPMTLPAGAPAVASQLRAAFKGTFIINGGYYTRAAADAVLAKGEADLVSIGIPFIANPDLPARLKLGAPLAEGDKASFYGGTEKGYTDYPALETVDA
ncbi:alkene reductase [Azospirillum sp. TSO22-1]|uniref:alkene reductase n=1 Tax=Azospirillum sp. TSO22-1 TaxID=716789 RepID=UPI000D6089E8|nr:alkene reductase [Azospirillum sp. TSO22-1]PWC53584.1 NADH:flavin oxidoreductase [Azospirillum sp. TSO22-1]